MIHVSLTLLVFIYLFGCLFIVFTQWLYFNLRRRRREMETLRFRVRCTICSFDFEDRSARILPRCPRCGSLNERYRFGTL